MINIKNRLDRIEKLTRIHDDKGILFVEDIPSNEYDPPMEYREQLEGESVHEYMDYLDSIEMEYMYVTNRGVKRRG